MRILFLHKRFPGQFRYLAQALGSNSRHTVVFGTAPPAGKIPGVSVGLFRADFAATPETHPFNRPVEEAVRVGQEAYRLARSLSEMNFIPDVIYGHSGSGPTLFMKDLFPRAKLLCYFEWFHRTGNLPADADEETRRATFAARVRNAPILTDLAACDGGLSPTAWQREQFPAEYRDRIDVIHDGIDASFFTPAPESESGELKLPRLGLNFPAGTEIITSVISGSGPLQGLPRTLGLLEDLLAKHPTAHAIIAGNPRRTADDPLPQGPPEQPELLAGRNLDPARIHFTGPLDPVEYRAILRASTLHLHLAPTPVLPWSLLEALSTGCLVLASDSPAHREAIVDGENAFIADTRNPDALVAHALGILERRHELSGLREHARQSILENYALAALLPRQIAWIENRLG